jgi:hypothetical protein
VRSKIRRSLTFANVCSALALFVALSTGTAYAANTIFSTDIVDGEVKREDLAGNAVNGSKIQNGAVGAADLAADSVGAATILDSSISALDLGDSSVGTSEIATDGVGATEISDNSIDGGEIVDGSLTASDLATSSVGTSELAVNAVDGSKVASNSLTTADIAGVDLSGSISLAAGAVANGRCEDFAISVPGALAGQAVLISVKANLAEGILIYGARVPSTDTVTMKVCNLSGGTMAAFSGLPIRTITFG